MPTEPVTAPAGQEMDLPYPSHALGVSFLTLAAVPAAVGYGRELTRAALERWGLAPLAADAEMVVSELATNAVRASGPAGTDGREGTEGTEGTYAAHEAQDADDVRRGDSAGSRWDEAGNVAAMQVRLLLFEASIVIEVWDGDPAAPRPHNVTGEQERGRGLVIVAGLSTRWGWFPVPRDRKVVWAELALP
jgi:hypothetical protein